MAGVRGRGGGQGRGRGRPRKIQINNFELEEKNDEESKEDNESEAQLTHANKGLGARSQIEEAEGSLLRFELAMKEREVEKEVIKKNESRSQKKINGTVTVIEESKEEDEEESRPA
ncbi:hypothetical protein A4A49_14122, partial [Nicotiana attenuata]